MYFQELEQLKDSKDCLNDGSHVELFDEILSGIYEKKFQSRFNPRVYKYFDKELDEVEWLSFLEVLRANRFIKKNFELCCPHCDSTFLIFTSYDELPFYKMIHCSNCDEELIVTEQDIFITFSFEQEFKPSGGGAELFRDISKVAPEKVTSLEDLQIYPELIVKEIIEGRIEKLKKELDNVYSAENTTEKGQSLENLAQSLFHLPPYLICHGRNVRYETGELDVLFKVKKITGTIFHNSSDLLIVECKNWNGTVGASQIRILSDKMTDCGANLGIMLSKKGISGDETHIKEAKGVIRRKWDQDHKIIIDVNGDDLNEVIFNRKNLYQLLESKYYKIKTV